MAVAGTRVVQDRTRAFAGNRQTRLERRERCQHEGALDDAGMRHAQTLADDRLAAIQQQVEIDGSRRPTPAFDAADLALDRFETVEDVGRRSVRSAVRHDIQERSIPIDGRVVGKHRRRFDDGRDAGYANTVRGQSLEGLREMVAAVTEVRAEPEININHVYSS